MLYARATVPPLLRRLVPVSAKVAHITSPVASIISCVAFILANVTSVTDVSAIRSQLGFRCAFFLIVAKIAHIGPAFAFVPAYVALVVADVARVVPKVSAIRMQVTAFWPGRGHATQHRNGREQKQTMEKYLSHLFSSS
jgi:hypothetical protein